jgi:hypothetical protein
MVRLIALCALALGRPVLDQGRRRMAAGSVKPRGNTAADIAYQNKAVIYDLLFKASSETMLTPLPPIPSISAHASASCPSCTPGVRTAPPSGR